MDRVALTNLRVVTHSIKNKAVELVQAIFGSHGTCASRAERIVEQGFHTSPGRIGNGAYFWTAMSEEHLPMSTLLAERWAKKCHEDWHAFEDEPDQALAVVQVQLEYEEDEALYLDEPKYHLDLRMKLCDFAVQFFDLNSIFELTKDQFKRIENKLYGIVEGYIKLVEKHLGSTIKVVFKCQISPHKRDVISQLVGNASCFSVRDTACIKSMHWSQA